MDDGSPPRVILGIHDGTHDAGAAVLVDGELVAACNEERFVRRKGRGGWPTHALRACLRIAGVCLDEVDRFALAGLVNPNPGLRAARPLQRRWLLESGRFYTEAHDLDAWFSQWLQFDSPFPRLRSDGAWVRGYAPLLRELLAAQLTLDAGDRSPARWRAFRRRLSLRDHHVCHAAGAYHGCGADDALVVVADGLGDGLALTVWRGEGGRLTRLGEMPYPHSYGLFTATITGMLGFRPFRHEGKLTALAAHGDAAAVDVPFPFEGPVERRRFVGQFGFPLRPLLEQLRRYRRDDVCAWLQQHLEDDIGALVEHWLGTCGVRHVALAGGLFANVQLNRRVARCAGVDEVSVFPHMGDGGLAVGAALLARGEDRATIGPPRRLEHAFLGPAWDDAAIGRELAAAGLDARPDAALVETVADALAGGGIVARFAGRMEFGPRALGHRTILAPADDEEIPAELNRRLSRSGFMPFAPVLRAEHADRWLRDLDAVRHAARFMTVAVPARAALRRLCPAAVHRDGTLRPQLVDRETTPGLWAILRAYEQRTGLPALINTSFNVHEEPIVCSPADAVRTFRAAGLDGMAIGGWWVRD